MRESPKKKKRMLKPRAMDVICFVGGLVIGEVIALLTQNVGFLKWLSHDVAFGFQNPIEITFVIFKFVIGFSIHLNPAVVLFALLGLVMSHYLRSSAKKKPSTPVSAPVADVEEEDAQ